jgi:N-acetyl-beta-hexosaminidase
MHIGGDENEGKQWNANPRIQAFMREKGIKDNHQLQTYFNKRILKFLQKGGKTMMGWGRNFPAGFAEGCRDSFVARAESFSRCRAAGFSGRFIQRLLH